MPSPQGTASRSLTCAQITNNTIIARSRDLLGGINMRVLASQLRFKLALTLFDRVDDFPFDRDYSNTRVVANTIRTEGAYIKLAIGYVVPLFLPSRYQLPRSCGPTCWSPWNPSHKINFGGSASHNILGPGTMGYGIALSGTKDWTALGNVVLPGTSFSGNTAKTPLNAPPMPFLIEWSDRARTVDCEVQQEFVEGEANWLIGIESGVGEKLRYEGGQLSLGGGEEAPKVAGGAWEINEGRFCLKEEGAGGRIVWASGAATKAMALRFARDGRLALTTKNGEVIWDPTAYLRPFLETMSTLQPLKPSARPDLEQHPSLMLSCMAPFLSLSDSAGNVQFSASYDYAAGEWALLAGQWIAIAPLSLRGSTFLSPPPIPSRPFSAPPISPRHPPQPTFLFLNLAVGDFS